MPEFPFLKKKNDEKLLRLIAKSGQRQPFEDLLERYEKKIYRFFFLLTGNQPTAVLWTRQAFLNIYIDACDFQGNEPASDWIYRMASQVALEELKIWSRKRELAEKKVPDHNTPNTSGKIFKLMDELKAHYRVAFVLSQFEKFNYETISTIMNADSRSVSNWVGRARRQLAKQLDMEGVSS